MKKLQPISSKYLYVGELFLHHRCPCNIIDLNVKEALHVVKPFGETFRIAFSFLSSSN